MPLEAELSRRASAIVYVQFVFVLGALMLLCAGFTYQGDFDRARALEKR